MEVRSTVILLGVMTLCLYIAEGRRVKRDLIQLSDMIYTLTGRDPLNFNGYGCYCGWGGSGTPVDKADGCCQRHDDCYGFVTNDTRLTDCSPKWNHYSWKIQDKSINCIDQAPTKSNEHNQLKSLLFAGQSCPRRICECDKALVECLYKSKYDKRNYKLDKGLRCKADQM